MARKKHRRRENRNSLLIGAVNTLLRRIYSVFTRGRIGEKFLANSDICKRNGLSWLPKTRQGTAVKLAICVEDIAGKSVVIRAFGSIGVFFAQLGLNVYGMLFASYGLVAIFMHYFLVIANGDYKNSEYALIYLAVMVICSIPMLFRSRSASEAIYESRFMRGITLGLFGIPAEKFKSTKCYNGAEFMFCAAIVGILLGLLTFFWNVLYLPLIFGILVLICVIFANPEAGVAVMFLVTPFLQYTDFAELILILMICVTATSYVCKLIRQRRTLKLTYDTVVLMIFCGFMLIASMFSNAGASALRDSLFAITVILGGYVLTYNLMANTQRLSVCVKSLIFSFVTVCIFGLLGVFYNGINGKVMHSVNEEIVQASVQNVPGIADAASVFGVFAVLVFPLLLSYLSKTKNAKSGVIFALWCILSVFSVWYFGNGETMIILGIEFCLFWILRSHKSLTSFVFLMIPIGLIFAAYPFAVKYFGVPTMSDISNALMPKMSYESSLHTAVNSSVLEMLRDGHLAGIGVGEHAFKAMFAAYADSVSSGAAAPLSLVLQVICWSGIGGLLAFIVFVLLLLKNSFGFFRSDAQKSLKIPAWGLFCSLFCVMLLGSVTDVWSDMRMLYLFWSCAGLLMGYIRHGLDEDKLKKAEFLEYDFQADAELHFHKR